MIEHPARVRRQTETTFRARWGWIAARQHAIVQRLQWMFGVHIYRIYGRPIEPLVGPQAIVPGFTFRVFQRGDEAALFAASARPELEITSSFVSEAFGKGDVCEAILCDGQIASFSWSAFTPTHDHDGVYIEFGDHCRYAYFAFTLPEYRGRYLPRLFKQSRDEYSSSRGCKYSISYISIDNRSSIRLALAAGNRVLGYAGYLKRGSFFLTLRSRGVRDSGLRYFVPRRQPSATQKST
jgi:hypothetical protein